MTTDSDSIVFAGGWVDANSFERAISNKELHEDSVRDVRFVFPPGCKIMVDAGVRLLSLGDCCTKSVAMNRPTLTAVGSWRGRIVLTMACRMDPSRQSRLGG